MSHITQFQHSGTAFAELTLVADNDHTQENGWPMVFQVHASTMKIRTWLETALSGFDTLDKDVAIAQAKLKLRCALEYLDSVDRAGDILKSGIPFVDSGNGKGREKSVGDRVAVK